MADVAVKNCNGTERDYYVVVLGDKKKRKCARCGQPIIYTHKYAYEDGATVHTSCVINKIKPEVTTND